MLLANSFQKLLSAILSFPHAPFSDALTAFPPICFIQSAIDSHFRCRLDHLTYFALHTTQCRSRHQLSMPRAYSVSASSSSCRSISSRSTIGIFSRILPPNWNSHPQKVGLICTLTLAVYFPSSSCQISVSSPNLS